MSDQTSCQMDFFPAVDGFDFVDDKLFAIPAHGDVILRTLRVTCVRQQVLPFHPMYGVGAQYAFTRHLSLRAEYRGLVYKAPSFNLAGLNTDSWTQIAQPSAGIVFRF